MEASCLKFWRRARASTSHVIHISTNLIHLVAYWGCSGIPGKAGAQAPSRRVIEPKMQSLRDRLPKRSILSDKLHLWYQVEQSLRSEILTRQFGVRKLSCSNAKRFLFPKNSGLSLAPLMKFLSFGGCAARMECPSATYSTTWFWSAVPAYGQSTSSTLP